MSYILVSTWQTPSCWYLIKLKDGCLSTFFLLSELDTYICLIFQFLGKLHLADIWSNWKMNAWVNYFCFLNGIHNLSNCCNSQFNYTFVQIMYCPFFNWFFEWFSPSNHSEKMKKFMFWTPNYLEKCNIIISKWPIVPYFQWGVVSQALSTRVSCKKYSNQSMLPSRGLSRSLCKGLGKYTLCPWSGGS